LNRENIAGYSKAKHKGIHYAWVISALTFLVLLVAAGVRTAPGVFIKPFEDEYGWSRGSISLAVAFSLLAYGLGGLPSALCASRWPLCSCRWAF